MLVATKGAGTAVKKGIKTTGKVIKIVSKPPKKLNGRKTIEGVDDKILKGVGGQSSGGTPLKTEGLGSSGRTDAINVQEQIAMWNAKINPLCQSKMIIEDLSDSRWSGWQKWEIVYRTSDSNITIHFAYDPVNGLFADFKFVYPK